MKKKFLYLLLSATFFLGGCARIDSLGNNLSGRVPVLTSKNTQKKSRADAVKKSIVEIEGVEDAAVVIQGNAALIGLKLKQAQKDNTEEIKQESARRARKADPGIQSTAITCNDEITQMIKDLEG